jgi:hypothetical protein
MSNGFISQSPGRRRLPLARRGSRHQETASWHAAVLLLGLAALLILAGAAFPEFFTSGFHHFGPDTP